MKYKISVVLSFISGIIFIYFGAIGSPGILGTLITIVSPFMPSFVLPLLNIVLIVLNFFALLGGIAIIAGGILLAYDKKFVGKFIIGLGAGSGVIGFIIDHVLLIISANLSVGPIILLMQSPLYWGTLAAILAMLLAREVKKKDDSE